MLNGRVLARRWAHLLLGGALLMPFFLLTSVVVGLAAPDTHVTVHLGWQLVAYGLALPLVAVAGLLRPVRPLEVAAVRALVAVPGSALADGPAGSPDARRRAAGWFLAHTALGGLVSGASLALPPAVVFLVAMPFVGPLRRSRWADQFPVLPDPPWLGPPLGLAVLATLLAAVAGAGALLARLAPALLGPTPADRLAAAERRAADLAVRNRLARELHDSVGHALSTVTLQAGAARTVLAADPDFAREALVAIEETARRAVAELDTVLGLLRDEEPGDRTPAPTLDGDLDGLLDRVRAAGVAVHLAAAPRPGALPPVVSREAYRIVQEGLSNAVRHAGRVPVRLRLAHTDEELTITVENPVPAAAARRSGGGRGLPGIAERATLLGGGASWEATGGTWRLVATLPLAGGPR